MLCERGHSSAIELCSLNFCPWAWWVIGSEHTWEIMILRWNGCKLNFLMCLKFKYLYFKSLFEMSDLVPVQPTPANQSAPVYQTPTYQQAASPSTSVPQSSLSFQSTPSSQPALGPQPSTTKPTSTTQPTLAPQPSPALQQSTTSYQAPATYQQSHSYLQPAVVSNQPIAVAMPMQQYNPKKNERCLLLIWFIVVCLLD